MAFLLADRMAAPIYCDSVVARQGPIPQFIAACVPYAIVICLAIVYRLVKWATETPMQPGTKDVHPDPRTTARPRNPVIELQDTLKKLDQAKFDPVLMWADASNEEGLTCANEIRAMVGSLLDEAKESPVDKIDENKLLNIRDLRDKLATAVRSVVNSAVSDINSSPIQYGSARYKNHLVDQTQVNHSQIISACCEFLHLLNDIEAVLWGFPVTILGRTNPADIHPSSDQHSLMPNIQSKEQCSSSDTLSVPQYSSDSVSKTGFPPTNQDGQPSNTVGQPAEAGSHLNLDDRSESLPREAVAHGRKPEHRTTGTSDRVARGASNRETQESHQVGGTQLSQTLCPERLRASATTSTDSRMHIKSAIARGIGQRPGVPYPKMVGACLINPDNTFSIFIRRPSPAKPGLDIVKLVPVYPSLDRMVSLGCIDKTTGTHDELPISAIAPLHPDIHIPQNDTGRHLGIVLVVTEHPEAEQTRPKFFHPSLHSPKVPSKAWYSGLRSILPKDPGKLALGLAFFQSLSWDFPDPSNPFESGHTPSSTQTPGSTYTHLNGGSNIWSGQGPGINALPISEEINLNFGDSVNPFGERLDTPLGVPACPRLSSLTPQAVELHPPLPVPLLPCALCQPHYYAGHVDGYNSAISLDTARHRVKTPPTGIEVTRPGDQGMPTLRSSASPTILNTRDSQASPTPPVPSLSNLELSIFDGEIRHSRFSAWPGTLSLLRDPPGVNRSSDPLQTLVVEANTYWDTTTGQTIQPSGRDDTLYATQPISATAIITTPPSKVIISRDGTPADPGDIPQASPGLVPSPKNTNSRSHTCPECHSSYPKPYQLRDHIQFKHTTGGKSYSCDFEGCNRAFATRSNMRRHFKRDHQEGNVSLVPQENDGRTPEMGSEPVQFAGPSTRRTGSSFVIYTPGAKRHKRPKRKE